MVFYGALGRDLVGIGGRRSQGGRWDRGWWCGFGDGNGALLWRVVLGLRQGRDGLATVAAAGEWVRV
jgi:hypothetical protein